MSSKNYHRILHNVGTFLLSRITVKTDSGCWKQCPEGRRLKVQMDWDQKAEGPNILGRLHLRDKIGNQEHISRIKMNHNDMWPEPTQIYRFLRTRNMLSPIFLNRNLSYMRQRMSRSHKSREGFKVDSILGRVIEKNRIDARPYCLGSYMTLTFLGYHDKSLDETENYEIKVETLLVKICHKKRKDSSSVYYEDPVGSASVPLNPSHAEPPTNVSAVSISSDAFCPSQGPNVKSYVLLLRVYVQKQNMNRNDVRNSEDEEPVQKRIKTEDSKLLGSQLKVYDKHNRCVLQGGEYSLVLRDINPDASIVRSPHKSLSAHWETISDDIDIPGENNPFDIFNICPTLKIRLSWNQEPCNGLVARPRSLQRLDINDDIKTDSSNSNKENNKPLTDKTDNTISKCNGINHSSKSNETTCNNIKVDNSNNSLQIIYQFLYNNNSRQQTEACEAPQCPWCSLDCGRLYALLKHLKLCHSRFSFTYSPIPRGARIDVSINELYDCSYAGSPHEACGPGGTSGSGPTRRTPITHILVWRPTSRRPQRNPPSNNLNEFLESDDNELTDAQRPYITGHNRLYHHTITCLPIYPKELEIDSEEETDPLWLQQKTMMMIDEFTDVNEGEKELMKMWNLHVMKYNFVGDCQIPTALQMFLQMKGKELLEKNLYRNFILHMCSLHDFGLLTSVVFYQTMQILLQMLSENTVAKQKMRENIVLQREHWKNVGMHQQPTLIEQKSSHQNVNKSTGFNGDSSPAVRRKTSSMQNTTTANRTISYNMQSPSSSGDTSKKKAETSAGNSSSDAPQRRKSIQLSQNVSAAINGNSKSGNSSEIPLRRKSAGTNGNNVVNNSQNRKRLSLHDRKNSA